MMAVALEMPSLFAAADLPLLLQYENGHVELSRRQCACLLAHSFFGSITESARRVRKEKWAFRASQLFFLEALPSALCFLNYFKLLGLDTCPPGAVSLRRLSFPRKCPPWKWEAHDHVMCPVEIVADGRIEDSSAPLHVDFANKFVGGGCLENDFNMEEILFAVKPELIVAMALCSYLQDEEVLRISGAIQYSRYIGYASTFEFEGDCDLYRQEGGRLIPDVVAMDALQGCAKIQFGEGLIRRDLDKARLAFDGEGRGACAVATGNWGCGAFGNDHTLKFLQQWLACSSAGVPLLVYHTGGDKRAAGLGGACGFQKNLFLASFQFGHESFICCALFHCSN
jgi:poly(ADP-ribose) glycohydrolase